MKIAVVQNVQTWNYLTKGNGPSPEPTDKMVIRGRDLVIGDEHHTMDDLYEHRHRLWLALTRFFDNYETPLKRTVVCWKSRLHDDGSEYPGWFILGMTVTKHHFNSPKEEWDISYHLPDKYWNNAKVMELRKAPPYDGYTPEDVLERLMKL